MFGRFRCLFHLHFLNFRSFRKVCQEARNFQNEVHRSRTLSERNWEELFNFGIISWGIGGNSFCRNLFFWSFRRTQCFLGDLLQTAFGENDLITANYYDRTGLTDVQILPARVRKIKNRNYFSTINESFMIGFKKKTKCLEEFVACFTFRSSISCSSSLTFERCLKKPGIFRTKCIELGRSQRKWKLTFNFGDIWRCGPWRGLHSFESRVLVGLLGFFRL